MPWFDRRSVKMGWMTSATERSEADDEEGKTLWNDHFAAPFDEDKFIRTQRNYSTSIGPAKDEMSKEEYLDHQKEVFDMFSDMFANDEEMVTDSVRPAIGYICGRFLKDVVGSKELGLNKRGVKEEIEELSILDVGCGTGVLWPFLTSAAEDMGMKLNITGVDLSPKMVARAKERVQSMGGMDHAIQVQQGDFVEWAKEATSKFDGIIMNAVFGNFYYLDDTMTSAASLLCIDGVVAISHPLGARFQEKLHRENSLSVRYPLPSLHQFRFLVRFQPLALLNFLQQVDLLDENVKLSSFPLYYASAKRVPHTLLPRIMRFRGKVASGYNRGGKKLGVPTANLPEAQFAAALENVPNGVYFGWAVVENPQRNLTLSGRNVYHKAVANIGRAPTFVGQEHSSKIIEAHLIQDPSPMHQPLTDFYNETLRLALCGYLRPELKFQSFSCLQKQIHEDIRCATHALQMQPFAAMRTDKFLVDPCRRVNFTDLQWVGNTGGDVHASWEFQDWDDALHHIPLGKFL